MRALEQMISAVGAPLSLTEFPDLDDQAVAVCRWRHGDGRFEVQSSDMLRIGMSLGGTFKGRHVGAGQVIDITGTCGCVGMFAPGLSCETTGEGMIDVIEIYVDPRSLGNPARGWPELPPIDCLDETIRAAMLATYVATRTSDPIRLRSAATTLRRLACQFLLSQARRRHAPREGGLRSDTRRRIEGLIDRRLDATRGCPANVTDLATEAGLSVNHFIRAFRETTETTPHKYFMSRRHQRAMALLGDPNLAIADVADSLGFSSPAHFTASFRQNLWVTPGDYRWAVFGIGIAPAHRSASVFKSRSGPGDSPGASWGFSR